MCCACESKSGQTEIAATMMSQGHTKAAVDRQLRMHTKREQFRSESLTNLISAFVLIHLDEFDGYLTTTSSGRLDQWAFVRRERLHSVPGVNCFGTARARRFIGMLGSAAKAPDGRHSPIFEPACPFGAADP